MAQGDWVLAYLLVVASCPSEEVVASFPASFPVHHLVALADLASLALAGLASFALADLLVAYPVEIAVHFAAVAGIAEEVDE